MLARAYLELVYHAVTLSTLSDLQCCQLEFQTSCGDIYVAMQA